MKKRGLILLVLLVLFSIFLVYAQTYSGKVILNEKSGSTGRLVSSDNLSVGDAFYLEDGRKARVTGVEEISGNFDNQNFFANGVLVHNKGDLVFNMGDLVLKEYGKGVIVTKVGTPESVRELLEARIQDWKSRLNKIMEENPGKSVAELQREGLVSEEEIGKWIYGNNLEKHLEQDVAKYTKEIEEGNAVLFTTKTNGGVNTQGIAQTDLSEKVFWSIAERESLGIPPNAWIKVDELGLNSNTIEDLKRALGIAPVELLKSAKASAKVGEKVYVVALCEEKNIINYFGAIGAYNRKTGQFINGAVDITDALKYPPKEILEGVINGEKVSGSLSNRVILIDVEKLISSCEFIEGTANRAAKFFRIAS